MYPSGAIRSQTIRHSNFRVHLRGTGQGGGMTDTKNQFTESIEKSGDGWKALDPEAPAFPCGLVAKSFFNDTFEVYKDKEKT